jgi:hypothetical protein
MTPKMMSDKEGEDPPCSIMWDIESARKWDQHKKEIFKGKAKSKKAIFIYWDHNPEQQPLWYRIQKAFTKCFTKRRPVQF